MDDILQFSVSLESEASQHCFIYPLRPERPVPLVALFHVSSFIGRLLSWFAPLLWSKPQFFDSALRRFDWPSVWSEGTQEHLTWSVSGWTPQPHWESVKDKSKCLYLFWMPTLERDVKSLQHSLHLATSHWLHNLFPRILCVLQSFVVSIRGESGELFWIVSPSRLSWCCNVGYVYEKWRKWFCDEWKSSEVAFFHLTARSGCDCWIVCFRKLHHLLRETSRVHLVVWVFCIKN